MMLEQNSDVDEHGGHADSVERFAATNTAAFDALRWIVGTNDSLNKELPPTTIVGGMDQVAVLCELARENGLGITLVLSPIKEGNYNKRAVFRVAEDINPGDYAAL